MLFRRKRTIRDVEILLRRAYAKALAAERLLYDRRLRMRIVISTAMAGLPLSGDFFSGLYSSDAYSDVRKALKIARELLERAEERERGALESLCEVLERARRNMHPSDLKSLIVEALSSIGSSDAASDARGGVTSAH